MQKITEQDSKYDAIERMSTEEVLRSINEEDKTVPLAVEKVLPLIGDLVDAAARKLLEGGRLFYIGAGTSGRLGILDASECPPTYGVSPDLVTGVIAGGHEAIVRAVENAEDNVQQGWKDLCKYQIGPLDVLIGIAASGTTPYVVGAVKEARKVGLLTGCITCNPSSPLAEVAEHPIEVLVGPEFITGSTRMKAGTAQKLVLNMISTCLMVKLGRIKGNKMVDMQINNVKLRKRGIRMLAHYLGIDDEKAGRLLDTYGSVRRVLDNHQE